MKEAANHMIGSSFTTLRALVIGTHAAPEVWRQSSYPVGATSRSIWVR